MGCKAAHLPRHQFPIRAPALHETVGGTIFDDPAALQHYDPVEITQRRKTMRDCDHCTPAHQARKRFANRLLGFAVERGGSFVEQQDRCVLQERTGNRDAHQDRGVEEVRAVMELRRCKNVPNGVPVANHATGLLFIHDNIRRQ